MNRPTRPPSGGRSKKSNSSRTRSTGHRQRVLLSYGTRPEVIKLAPVIRALESRPDRFAVFRCCTAQHRELIDDVQELFGLRPDHDLNLMRPDQSLNDLASRALSELDPLLERIDPDWVLVQGDTTTALITALAAFHRHCPVAHVEAGLRTGDLRAPFPEEGNRRLTDQVADLLFAPTRRAEQTLLDEGHDPQRIHRVGNTVVDALQWIGGRLPDEPAADEVLITVHRRESFGQPLQEVIAALRELASRFPETHWILPIHRNPNVAEPIRAQLSGIANLELSEPLRYDELVRRLKRARLVLTDSGGIQEEAPAFGKPVLVLREKTERPEGVEAGVARLVGTERERIVAQASRLLTDASAYREMSRSCSPYGDGSAASRIASVLAGEPFEPFAG